MKTAFVVSWWIMGSALAQQTPPPEEEAPPGQLPRLGLGVQAGYLLSRDGEGRIHGGAGLLVQGLAHLTSYFSIGPEVSLYAHAGSKTFVQSDPRQGEVSHTRDAPLLQLGGVMQLGGELGPVHPYVLLGASWHKGVDSGLGFSAGLGMRVRLTDRWAAVGEARLGLRFPSAYGPSLNLGTVYSW